MEKNTPNTDPLKSHESFGDKNTTKEGYNGIHDYLSKLRMHGFAYSKGGQEGLWAYIQENKLPSFKEYFNTVSNTNVDLRTKIERDLVLYKGITIKLETLINAINNASSKEEAFTAYENLKEFFKPIE